MACPRWNLKLQPHAHGHCGCNFGFCQRFVAQSGISNAFLTLNFLTMEERTLILENLVESATDFGKASFQLAKLQALDKTADIISSIVPRAISFLLVFTFVLFGSIGLSAWLNALMESTFLGYFVVAGGYLVVALAAHLLLHNWLKLRLSNLIIQHVIQ